MLSFQKEESVSMKFIRFLGFFVLLISGVSTVVVAGEFQDASKLLVAARRGDIQTVQVLINSGVDVNYVDSTGLSLVCTAVMNNDKRAIQVLQMYGADASDCDRQIKQYQQKTTKAAKGEQYGFFSGLSSTHVIVLSALGVAAVVGGVVLLTDVFDGGGGHHSSGTNGDRPNNNNNEGGGTSEASKLFAQNLPVGPGACTGKDCSSEYPTWEGMLDFDYMSDNTVTGNADVFNYLMVSHGYDAFARGYLGMGTIRLASNLAPFDLSSLPSTTIIGGGDPKNVAMITGNGVNATGSAVDGTITWVDSDQIPTVQSICAQKGDSSSECQAAMTAATKVSHKYYNLNDGSENVSFDLSGSGTVFGLATNSESKLAKIIAGWQAGGRATPDFYGFIPNGQLTVYKTGAGTSWVEPDSSVPVTGAYTMTGTTLAEGDKFYLFDTVLTVDSVDGYSFVATSGDDAYQGYLVGDKLFISSTAGGNINQMYVMGAENSLTLTKELVTADYKNYSAIYEAVYTPTMNFSNMPDVIVNLSLPSAATGLGYATLKATKKLSEESGISFSDVFLASIDNYYDLNENDNTDTTVLMPSTAANLAFTNLGKYSKQIFVNPAGRTLFGMGEGESVDLFEATFENFAPIAYNNLQNLFMTVVAVRPADGTKDETIAGYSPENTGTLELSTWADPNDSSTIYSSRICGLAGNGNNGAMNPWCFAAPGATDLEATASMAGAVALVKSAFDYMSPKEVFLLLALTADGPYLGTNPATSSKWASTTDLITYLKENYTLPSDFDSSDAKYLDSFKTVFGYGMINLERATRPGTNIYFYSSDKETIVSGSNSAYWRGASLKSSSVLSLTNRGAIKTAFYDVLESADGTMSLPRVWNMNFIEDRDSKHGLYMGDVLADFAVDSSNKRTNQIGNFTFDMALSPRAYNDNLNGLDSLRVAFNNEKYDVDANYQRFLTDGESRFNGRANGVLSLVSNSVASGAKYKIGNFAFGTRAFSGTITDENLLENDPAISSQFEPARLGLANGVAIDTGYKTDKFAFNLAVGNLHETNTVLGMYSDGILAMRGGDTQYIDAIMEYKPFEHVKLSMRGTFADTHVDKVGGIISDVSDIKSNAFAVGADVGGFEFTAAMPLATVSGKMGYDYAEFNVVENNGNYEISMDNPHVEYIDLAKQKRELRFSSSYKTPLGEWTDAGVGFIYRVNPNNTDEFGNESLFMFKLHHRLGI